MAGRHAQQYCAGEHRQRNLDAETHGIGPGLDEHALAVVTVADPSVLRADALSAVSMVLGPDEGYAFAERHDVAACFIMRQGTDFVARATPRFKSLFPGQDKTKQ